MTQSVVRTAPGARARGALRRAVGAALLSSFLLSACYTQMAVAPAGPTPGTRVLLQLTPQGSLDLAPRIGSGVAFVEGITTEVRASEWEVSMVRTELSGGGETAWNREVVAFPVASVARVTERRFEKGRSYILAGLITLGVLAMGRAFGDEIFAGGEDNGGGGNPPQ